MITSAIGGIVWLAGIVRATWIGRLVAAAAVFLAAWQINNFVVASRAKTAIIEESKAEGAKRNEKSAKARENARRTPGSASRLPCRDC